MDEFKKIIISYKVVKNSIYVKTMVGEEIYEYDPIVLEKIKENKKKQFSLNAKSLTKCYKEYMKKKIYNGIVSGLSSLIVVPAIFVAAIGFPASLPYIALKTLFWVTFLSLIYVSGNQISKAITVKKNFETYKENYRVYKDINNNQTKNNCMVNNTSEIRYLYTFDRNNNRNNNDRNDKKVLKRKK